MKPSKYLHDEAFQTQIALLEAGQTTRAGVCEALGIRPSDLSKRIKACGYSDRLRHTKLTKSLPQTFKSDPDNAEAIAKAQRFAPAIAYHQQNPAVKLTEVARKFDVNYQALYYQLKTARNAQN